MEPIEGVAPGKPVAFLRDQATSRRVSKWNPLARTGKLGTVETVLRQYRAEEEY